MSGVVDPASVSVPEVGGVDRVTLVRGLAGSNNPTVNVVTPDTFTVDTPAAPTTGSIAVIGATEYDRQFWFWALQ